MPREGRRLTGVRVVQVRHDGPDVDDRAMGLDQQRRKGLDHAQNAPEIDVEHFLGSVNVRVQARNNHVLSRVVDQVVELASCLDLDTFDGRGDGRRRSDIELKEGRVGQLFETGHLGCAAGGRENFQPTSLEFQGQGVSDTTGAAACDKDCLRNHFFGALKRCWLVICSGLLVWLVCRGSDGCGRNQFDHDRESYTYTCAGLLPFR